MDNEGSDTTVVQRDLGEGRAWSFTRLDTLIMSSFMLRICVLQPTLNHRVRDVSDLQ